MTETIEQEAGRRVREQVGKPGSHSPGSLHALALEQLVTEHRATQAELEAFRQEVSDALEKRGFYIDDRDLGRFIIPQPDPLHECLEEALARTGEDLTEHTERLRAALAARGLKIVDAIDAD